MLERIIKTQREGTCRNELDEVLWRYFIDTVIKVGTHESREYLGSIRTY
jgi:hypothetical protein